MGRVIDHRRGISKARKWARKGAIQLPGVIFAATGPGWSTAYLTDAFGTFNVAWPAGRREGETKDGRMRKQVKARRTYKCYRCNETISPGDLYTKEFLRYGHGDFEVIQLCKGCVSPVLVQVEGDDTAYARTQRDYDEECGFHDE